MFVPKAKAMAAPTTMTTAAIASARQPRRMLTRLGVGWRDITDTPGGLTLVSSAEEPRNFEGLPVIVVMSPVDVVRSHGARKAGVDSIA